MGFLYCVQPKSKLYFEIKNMFSPIEEIKSRLDIVEVIQGYTRLQKSGINYRAVCPFHSEKTPSFFISPARQIWHCFGGCGEGGDIFKFVMKIEGLDFPEALRLLAQRAGVVLKREDPSISSERNRLYDLCEEAALVFQKNLSLTPAAQSYLKKRGVAENMIKEFRLGFAPQSWDFLLKALSQKGFRKEEVEKAGLAIKSEDHSSYYDRFRSRLMFPITDANERVIGFGGRIFQLAGSAQAMTNEAKYVNIPNTLIYDKSRALYGFAKGKNEIRSQNQVVVVEGYMDCLMSHQAGVKNTIAVSGTALTSEHLKMLRRLCENIISSFDTDQAGEQATKKSLALAAQFDFERKIAAIPAGKDPADTVLENPELWVKAVAEAKPIVEFYFAKVSREKNPNTVQGKKEIAVVLLPLLAELKNEIEKAHWVGKLAELLEVKEETVWKELEKKSLAFAAPGETRTEGQKTTISRRELLEERLLTLLTLIKKEIQDRELKDHVIIFTSTLRQNLFDMLRNEAAIPAATADFKNELEVLKFKGEALKEISKNPEEEFLICKRELERESIKEELLKIGAAVDRLEKANRAGEITPLLQSFRSLSEKLKTLY